ncbi:hypothetical protein GCM10020358_57680 [Amorphoplanes nipponensis]|uniref:SMI1/KNR4 family protein n=1 Tax=Actinoplanes nipponensis TaxID=135950 RepID=A0A919JEB5_9ACTN|nr:hypothetical protein [Actinoplanes nipponensis]GIE47800.1 hypothetical protein Ani05nite_13340 [Actinoplanes nipponensis]
MIDEGTAAADLLAAAGRFPIRPGLTEAEFAAVEQEFGFSFADDHRAFLAVGLPFGRGWPDWRDGDRAQLREKLAMPVEGVLFDVAENGFWYEGWGPQPAETADAVTVARRLLMTVPRLVPVYAHRYLPAGRGTSGHPVLSVMQTDIISYGADLRSYVRHEFGGEPLTPGRPTVAFWRDLAG